jgi:hypothetical protein
VHSFFRCQPFMQLRPAPPARDVSDSNGDGLLLTDSPCYRFCMSILKQAAFSIAFAVLAVAVAEYVIWILEQKGWLNP